MVESIYLFTQSKEIIEHYCVLGTVMGYDVRGLAPEESQGLRINNSSALVIASFGACVGIFFPNLLPFLRYQI